MTKAKATDTARRGNATATIIPMTTNTMAKATSYKRSLFCLLYIIHFYE